MLVLFVNNNYVLIYILGGCLLIAEAFLDEDKTGPKSVLLQSLNMLLQMQGRERTAEEYKEILQNKGFVDIQTKKLEPSVRLDAILCRKAWWKFKQVTLFCGISQIQIILHLG